MYKVTLSHMQVQGVLNANDYVDMLDKIDDMKQWCRDNFGKGHNGKRFLWKSCINWYEYYDEVNRFYDICEYPVFMFDKEEHATWFSIRWG